MRERIKAIMLEMDIEEKDIQEKDYIMREILDSLAMAELIMSLEDSFGIEIDGEDIIPENFRNLDAIEKLVSKYVIK